MSLQREAEIARLDTEITQHRSTIDALSSQLRQRDTTISTLRAESIVTGGRLVDKDAQITNMQRTNAALKQQSSHRS